MLPLSSTSDINSDIPHQLADCIAELENQSIHPPGEDRVIQSCYRAVLELLENPELSQKFAEILTAREFTASHFVNILFRSIQYIQLYHMGNNSYPLGYDEPQRWKGELSSIFESKYDLLKTLLLTKDTTTTIYQRYAGSKSMLNALFPKGILSVADLGCGGNYGLPGLIKNKSFESIIDHTRDRIVTSLIKKPTTITSALAIDKENPYKNESKEWRYSCSFYPHELHNATEIILPDNDESETIFTRFDLTKSDNDPIAQSIPPHFYDAVIMSTFLYQLNKTQVNTVLEFAKRIVKKEGIIIIQDFAQLDPLNSQGITLISNWFSIPNPYRTFIAGERTQWNMKEILQWGNGRCKEVYEGQDFDFILKK